MVNNKNANLNNINSELPKKKRGNPNFIKKQNEIIEVMPSDQIINDDNKNNNNNEINDNIVITDDDYNDCNNNSSNTNENLDTINTSQEVNTKKAKKNTSLYELLSRPSGATMEELEKELNWKKASIRGTISNLQKQQQFCLMTINIIKSNLDFKSNKSDSDIENNKSFYKETRYFIKGCEFTINEILNK